MQLFSPWRIRKYCLCRPMWRKCPGHFLLRNVIATVVYAHPHIVRMIAATAASVGIDCWHRRARQTNLQHSHSELLPLFTFSRRQCNTTNSNSQRWVCYLLYWETYTGSIIVELPVPFWSRYRSVLIIVQSSLVSLLSVGWRSRSGYYTCV